jgi:predicted permease
MVAPLIMLSVGLSLRASTMVRTAGPLAVLSALRLLVAPIIAIGLGWLLFGTGDAAVRVLALEAGMPAMMLTLVVGERFGLDTDFIASAIFVTTAASALTLPLLQLAAFR